VPEAGSAKTPRLLLIDVSSLLYRAFNAVRPLSTSTGHPTNALYGFTSMLLRLLQEQDPEALAWACDTPQPTFRHQEYAAYKAHRPPTPDDLIAQIPPLRELAGALAIPIYEVDGYEADDVLGTLARQGEAAGWEVLIVTGDRDCLQLVTERVHVLATQRGISALERFDPAAVEERYGVQPGQLADLQGLKGDSSDNIPGVPGIGGKTAARLIRQYGSLEELLAHREEVANPRVRDALQSFAEQARLSKRLALIRTDLPLTLDLAACTRRPLDLTPVRELFRRYEFFSLLKRLAPDQTAPRADRVYQPVRTDDQRRAFITRLAQVSKVALALAKEPHQADPQGLALALGPGEAFYLEWKTLATALGLPGPPPAPGLEGQPAAPLRLFDEEGQPAVGPAASPTPMDLTDLIARLERGDLALLGHDLKDLLLALRSVGVEPSNLAGDTLLLGYLLNPARPTHELADLALEHLDLSLSAADPAADLSPTAFQACARADAIGQLIPVLEEALVEQGLEKVYRELELPLVPVLTDLTTAGFCLDLAYLKRLQEEWGAEIEAVRRQVVQLAGREFNLDSPRQLQAVLFTDLGLPPGRKTKAGYSTDAETLTALAGQHEIIPLLLHYRELTKLKSTYLDVLVERFDPQTGRIHTEFHQTSTSTGRISTAHPNLQNIPFRTDRGRAVRRAFVSPGPDWVLLSADYEQIEMRLLAEVSGDERLRAAFAAGEDVHARAASEIFHVPLAEVTEAQRRVGKMTNFGIAYGMSPFGLSQRLDIDLATARAYIEQYFARFPGVRAYVDRTLTAAREDGYVQTLWGRKRFLPDLRSPSQLQREAAERAAINMPIQGTAADLIKRAMIRVWQQLRRQGRRARLILQVHDELVLEVPQVELEEIAEMVRTTMATVTHGSVPLEVKLQVGSNWQDLEAYQEKIPSGFISS